MEGEDSQKSMIREIRELMRSNTLAHWVELFRRTDACVEPVLSLEEAFRAPQARHRKIVVEMEHLTEGKIRQLDLPFKLTGTPCVMRSAAPLLGQHTREILISLGYSDQQIQGLHDRG